jgi:hypothetical protein
LRPQVVGCGGDHVERDLDMHRPRSCAAEYRECARQHLRQFIGAHQRMAERGQARHQDPLRGQFMQATFAKPELVAAIDAGDHQQGYRIAVSLTQRGCDIGQPRSGNDEARGRSAAGAGVAVGHETGALLMARGDMTNLGVAETPVKLDRVDAGDPEDRVDPVLLQETDQRLATSRHLVRPKL